MDANIKPLIQHQAYVHIKEAIITLRLRPGERLHTAGLADPIHMSRTPVREALGKLEQEGLVRREKGWGYVVATMSTRDIRNLYSVREALEVEAAIEAIANLDAKLLKQLIDINRKAEKHYGEDQYDSFLMENRKFYVALAGMTGNALLQQMLGLIHDRVRWIGAMLVNERPARAHEVLLANRKVLVALKSRKRKSVESTVRTHIRDSRDHALRMFERALTTQLSLQAS